MYVLSPHECRASDHTYTLLATGGGRKLNLLLMIFITQAPSPRALTMIVTNYPGKNSNFAHAGSDGCPSPMKRERRKNRLFMQGWLQGHRRPHHLKFGSNFDLRSGSGCRAASSFIDVFRRSTRQTVNDTPLPSIR